MRSEKKLLLDEIKDKIQSSNAMIVTKYQKAAPDMAWEFRQKLRETGADFEVMKKRLLQKAAEDCGIAINLSEEKGNVGVVFLQEQTIEGTKAFFAFNKTVGGSFTVLLGKYERVYSPTDVEELSKLPTTQEIRAQLMGLLAAPMSQIVSVMNSALTGIIYCLENKSQKSNTNS